jgi:DHA1 family inner membrane transport protein
MFPASSPELASAFDVSGATAAAVALAGPLVLATLLEPPLLLLADRSPDRRPWVRAGLLAMAASCALAALAPSLPVLVAALALLGPSTGLACGVAEAGLVEMEPGRAEQRLTRWTLLGVVGDVAAPAMLAAAVAVGSDWRGALLAVAAATTAVALLVPPLPRATAVAVPGTEAPRVRAVLMDALRDRRLLAWIAGMFLCTLMDEIFVAFAALHIAERFSADPQARALVLGAFLAGGTCGLLAQERALASVAPRRLLAALAGACAAAYLAWIAAPSLAISAVLAAVVGLTCAGQYPLAQAQAYRAVPGRGGVVNALSALLTPVEVALPIGLAAMAGQLGVTAVLLVLAVQPLGLLALALLAPRDPDERRAPPRPG